MATSPIAKLHVKPQGNSRSEPPRRSSIGLRPTAYKKRQSKYVVSSSAKKKTSVSIIFRIIRRLIVVAAAIQYISVSMSATWRTMEVLRSVHSPPELFAIYTTPLIAGYAGDGLVRDGPLVQDVLGGDTTPRHHAIYLESETSTSTENCSNVPLFNSDIYNYGYLSRAFEEMVNDIQYNITDAEDLELVLVVVDCTFTQLQAGDPSMVRVFYLERLRSDPNELYLVSVSMSVQDYEISAHSKRGPGLLAMITAVYDMASSHVDQIYLMALTYPYQRSLEFEVYEFVGITENSYLELRSIPEDPLTQPVKHLLTTRERGFYDAADQSNIAYTYSFMDAADASTALTNWHWIGEAVSADSWAWVHGIHFFLGMQMIFSLFILFLISYRNLRAGKVWIGDPFSSVSTSNLVVRGILVGFSWRVDSFWMIYEYSLSNAASITGAQLVHIHAELVHADVMVVYLGLVGLISTLFRERIDPSLAIFMFELNHKYRFDVIRYSSAVVNEVITYSNSIFTLGITKETPGVAGMSPLWLWTSFQVPPKNVTFLAASFFPKLILLCFIVLYAIGRKVYRYYSPEQTHERQSRSYDQSGNEKAALSLKGNLTNFEISTGAELQTRFGLVSDYSNYVFFKGMKFASADGVYCSGYVIANGKFLVSTRDLVAVVLIKILDARFTNVYVYEVEGNTVKDTARLVYPKTFTWTDLSHLNVNVLL